MTKDRNYSKTVSIFAGDLQEPESPVILPDKSWLVVEMSEIRGCVTHVSPDGKQIQVIAKTGRPNGLAVDRNGVIWVAESGEPSLLCMSLDGSYQVFLNDCNGLPFIFPNDLCFGPDGYLYMTDSGILMKDFAPGNKLRPDYALAPIDGRLYQINPLTAAISLVDRGFRFINGIAFGPDNYLYVNETLTGFVYRYKLDKGKVGRRQYFGDVSNDDDIPDFFGPDGMKFGINGNLYVAVLGQRNVTVLGHDGSVLQRIHTIGKGPTNLAFGLASEKKIYVTEEQFNRIEVIDVDTEGFPLYG